MGKGLYHCSRCKQHFYDHEATAMHISDKHKGKGEVLRHPTKRELLIQNEQMADRIEALEREKLEEVAAALEMAAARMSEKAEIEADHSPFNAACFDVAERSIRALPPADAQAALAARDERVREEALRVKPLVWSGRGAFCDFGVWQIVTDDDGDFGYRFSGSPNVVFWHWKTEEEAKDAAQADRERRILSALIEGDTDD